MERTAELEAKIRALYEAKDPSRADWADWMYVNHVFVVADNARRYANRFDADPDLAAAAGMLHDIADAVMRRENPAHEETSLLIARSLLQETGFTESEIAVIVDDAIRFHSCHGNDAPKTPEGKAMATGDAVAHLATDFYDYFLETLSKKQPIEEVKKRGLEKIERDYLKKIVSDEVREEVAADYERVKKVHQ